MIDHIVIAWHRGDKRLMSVEQGVGDADTASFLISYLATLLSSTLEAKAKGEIVELEAMVAKD